MRTMKMIVKWLVAVVLCAPVLLLFTESKDGGVTVWNYVGLLYLGAWIALAYWKSRAMEREEEEFHDSLKIDK